MVQPEDEGVTWIREDPPVEGEFEIPSHWIDPGFSFNGIRYMNLGDKLRAMQEAGLF